MNLHAATTHPYARLREKAGMRARRHNAALFHQAPFIPTLLPQAGEGLKRQ
jgi:hypothetical protein